MRIVLIFYIILKSTKQKHTNKQYISLYVTCGILKTYSDDTKHLNSRILS